MSMVDSRSNRRRRRQILKQVLRILCNPWTARLLIALARLVVKVIECFDERN
ncbi:hypothetical protein [Azospirillum thermophilum]|uniref:hypothetical protein n=1 Tax=Azospirillum thermophilum TaxID=2202148 RepID=UPI00143CF955|nr:hypothetical protein [Azospirillum thermophilum]